MKKIYLYVAFALASIGMISCTDILDQTRWTLSQMKQYGMILPFQKLI